MAVAAPNDPQFHQVGTLSLGEVAGRIDHMDTDGKRLFVSALGNDTVEALDLRTGHRFTLGQMREPQGIGYASAEDRMLVANDGGGLWRLFEASTLHPVAEGSLGDDADDVRCRAGIFYVGYGRGGIALLEARTGRELKRIPVDGHPESFQATADGSRIYVNVPDAREIQVLDVPSSRTVARWRLTGAEANFPMALDDQDHHLFIGCRAPARLLVFDTRSGRQLSQVDIDGDTDDIYYDPARHAIYASCGAGFVDVVVPQGDHYSVVQRLATAPGARTSLFAPEHGLLYVAAPHRAAHHAEILIERVSP